ncbi:MAG: 16S rRNA (guanine(527)-N(7))-methyltransferase RsmG [Planctomycetes bacterium]|nr:16S rRNA (guanine(527)-N(7))-methyltransferase RsmG [Planctomycetota bacterium]
MGTLSVEFEDTLSQLLDRWRIDCTPVQLGMLRAHFESVLEANSRMNLTRITDPTEAAVKHYADSLALLLWIRDRGIEVGTVLDVGSGAGFPAVPLAVMRPDWQVTALDGTAKKIGFVEGVAETLGLPNLRAVHAHSTHWRDGWTADVVTVRAVAKLAKCMRDTVDLVAPNGWLVAYKTADIGDDELSAAQLQCADGGFRSEPAFEYELPLKDDRLQRALYSFRKTR